MKTTQDVADRLLRDASVPGRGLQPGLDERDWEAIRALVYQGSEHAHGRHPSAPTVQHPLPDRA